MKQVVKDKKVLAIYVTLALMGTTLGSQSVWAAESNDEVYILPDVVVTATRTEQQVDKVPASVTVLQGEDLQERHQDNLGEVLRIVPGVDINNYSGGVGYTNLNSFRINGSNNVLYMVDGINMNAAGVNPPMTTMKNMDGIDRVEVMKGAASTLYGSGAIGGVVNVITRVPDEGMRTTMRVIGGSYDQEQYKVMNEGQEGNVYWRASYQKDLMGSYKDAHGLTIPQHLDSHTTSFMVGSDINADNNVMFSYDSYRANVKYADSNNNLTNIRRGHEANDSFRGIWKQMINERLSHQLYMLHNHYDTTYDGYNTDIKTVAIGDQVTYALANHTLIGGIDWRQDKVGSLGDSFEMIRDKKLSNTSVYVQDTWEFAPKWTLTPGVRVDHHSEFGTHTSPHIALGYDVNDKTNIYLAYNEYFLAPTPYQLFSQNYGNPNLKPETGHEIDFGVHHQFSNYLWGNVNFFTRHSTDKIDFNYINWKYANVDSEKARGFSLDLRKQITQHLSATVAYTYTHIDGTSNRAANANGYVPKHSVNFSLGYNDEKWDAHLDVRGVIDRPGRSVSDDKGDFFPKSTYWITNISANYRVNDDFTIFGRVNNIFDVYYAEMSNVAYGGSRDWWTMPGRNYQLGVEVSF